MVIRRNRKEQEWRTASLQHWSMKTIQEICEQSKKEIRLAGDEWLLNVTAVYRRGGR